MWWCILPLLCVSEAWPISVSSSTTDSGTQLYAKASSTTLLHPTAGLMRSCAMCTLEDGDGKIHAYQGPLVKVVQHSVKLLTVQKGELVPLMYGNLAEWFGVSEGTYTLHVKGVVLQGCAGLAGCREDLVEDSVQVYVTSSHVELAHNALWKRNSPLGDPVQMDVQYSTSSCSVDQQTTLSVVTDLLGDRVDDAITFFGASCAGCKYDYWFGSYSSSRYVDVKGGFEAMQSKIAASSFIYDCSNPAPCGDGIIAFVYAGDVTHRIHLCTAFWGLPSTWSGYDTQPGTVCHEMSHFSSIEGTVDHVYGTTAALSLASSSPSLAIDNADNWEYFLEQGGVSSTGCDTSLVCAASPPSGSDSTSGASRLSIGFGWVVLMLAHVAAVMIRFMRGVQ